MSLFDIISAAIVVIRGTYKLATTIRDSEKTRDELKDTAKQITTDLTIVGGLLNHLQKFSHRITVHDGAFLITQIIALKTIVEDVQQVLEEVNRDRNFFQRLFMRRDEYRQQLRDCSTHLHNACTLIQGVLPAITRIKILRLQFPDFRKIFNKVSEKGLSLYEFSIIKDTLQSVSTITLEEFNSNNSLCYMKLGNEQFIVSYQLRTWSALNPKPIVLEKHRREFGERFRNKSTLSHASSNSSIDSISSTHSQPQSSAPQATAAATNINPVTLDFSEFYMSHDDICGMTFTQSFIYIATKYEITIVSLSKQEIIAQYGTEGDDPNTFKQISYIYIPSNDETNLYIVDRGQYAIHQYKIDDSGLRFEYVYRYVVIADVSEPCNLISCVIYNRNLYVSDDANNCLHIFPLTGERQSSYLTDNLITPFSPGALCVDGKYLYVANCSSESPGILVFNEQCEPINWFHNHLLEEILAIDIDRTINELYILTTATTHIENNVKKKRPLIASINLVTH